MDTFQILMTVGALIGLVLVVFGAFLLVKKFQGDIEIELKIGSLKTGSAGLAVISLGLIFFMSCALSVKTAADSTRALSQKDGEISQHEAAATTLVEQLAGALSGQSDETKNAVLAILLKAEEPGPASAAPGTPATSGPPHATGTPAAPPASSTSAATSSTTGKAPSPILSPSYHALSATFVTALLHTVTPESLAKMKETNPRLQVHLATAPTNMAPATVHAVPH